MISIKQIPSWGFVLSLAALLEPFVGARYAITGVQTGIDTATGARPLRLNILDLQKDIPSWSLYIQALVAMQKTPEDDLLSWFQVSGIHGRPFIPWDGYTQHPDAPDLGYCTHFSPLFAIWHRPYVALFEQILANHVQSIAKTYNSPTYISAADRFRVPYWDPATSAGASMPDITNTDTVTITTPSGQQTIPNPLLAFSFLNFPLDPVLFPDTGNDSHEDRLSHDPHTLRMPTGVAPDRVSNPSTVNANLNNAKFMENTFNFFTKATTFNAMSNGTVSVEEVHNRAHQHIGGRLGGHMGPSTYAGFDPIFMLLHANIDRLLAMWQAIYPDPYLLPATSSPTFTIPDHGAVDENTPLAPFTSGDGQTAHTAATSRYLKTFGHSYPEIQDWNQTPEELKANVTAQMNALYNPGGVFTTIPKRSNPRSMLARQSGLEVGQARQWSVTAQILNSDLKAPLFVHVFLGNPPTEATGWSEAGNLVGSMVVRPLGRPGEVVAAHEFSLHNLLRKSGVDPEDVDASIAYLKANLSWGVQEFDGNTVVPNDLVKGLSISVADDIVTLPKSNTELPIYEMTTQHPEVTVGKVGGLQ